MATTIEELSGILTRDDIKHVFDKDGEIYFGFQTENYTNPAGDKSLGMHLRISNEGQMFSLTAHEAFLVKGSKHIDAFLKLCSILQMSGYLTIRTRVKILLDACLATTRQLMLDHQPKLAALAAALLDKEALYGEQVEKLICNADAVTECL